MRRSGRESEKRGTIGSWILLRSFCTNTPRRSVSQRSQCPPITPRGGAAVLQRGHFRVPSSRESPPVEERSPEYRTGDVSSDVLLLAARYEDAGRRRTRETREVVKGAARVCLFFFSSSGSSIPPGPGFSSSGRLWRSRCAKHRSRSLIKERWFPEKISAIVQKRRYASLGAWQLANRDPAL